MPSLVYYRMLSDSMDIRNAGSSTHTHRAAGYAMKKITATMLRENNACTDQVALFLATFGESATLTKANMAKAIKAGLSVGWAACILSTPAQSEYAKARAAACAEYDKATAPAWDEYEKAMAAAWDEYEKVWPAALLSALRGTP